MLGTQNSKGTLLILLRGVLPGYVCLFGEVGVTLVVLVVHVELRIEPEPLACKVSTTNI